jgi:hypothetical protein
MTFERMSENSDTVTIFPTAESAQVRPLEQTAILTGTDGDLDPDIVTIWGLYKM